MRSEEWLSSNEHLLGSPYEKLFVVKVLTPIHDLDLSTIQAQFSFKDADGKQRYCDFALMEGSDVRIAIEVDGYDKRGTGTGMTRQEFLDWQRRQAALTAQGWFVLRFANTDVRDEPHRCREHLELLLRRERLRQRHQDDLATSIATLTEKLKTLENIKEQAATDTEKERLAAELQTLKRQLRYAVTAKPLDAKEREHLEELQEAQAHIKVLKEENALMKTTIWAFTALMAVMIVTFAFTLTDSSTPATDGVNPLEASALRSTRSEQNANTNGTLPTSNQITAKGSSCDNPEDWRNVSQHTGKSVAIYGPIMRVTHRQDVRGEPTWIEIGAAFPSKERVTLIIWGNYRETFEPHISQRLIGESVCATGTVDLYREMPQLELQNPTQLTFL